MGTEEALLANGWKLGWELREIREGRGGKTEKKIIKT